MGSKKMFVFASLYTPRGYVSWYLVVKSPWILRGKQFTKWLGEVSQSAVGKSFL